jgi:hypothetical protein
MNKEARVMRKSAVMAARVKWCQVDRFRQVQRASREIAPSTGYFSYLFTLNLDSEGADREVGS